MEVGANQKKKLCLMAEGNASHAHCSANWLTAMQSRTHACAYANPPPRPEPHLHTHTCTTSLIKCVRVCVCVCSGNFLINTCIKKRRVRPALRASTAATGADCAFTSLHFTSLLGFGEVFLLQYVFFSFFFLRPVTWFMICSKGESLASENTACITVMKDRGPSLVC